MSRLPIPNAIFVTKIEAGVRQLDESIRMYFEERDVIAVHTLAAAACQVLLDLAKAQGIKTIASRVEDQLTPEGVKVFRAAMREAQNFFKHADRPSEAIPSASLEFSAEQVEFILFDAVNAADDLTKSRSTERDAFRGWFVITKPDVVNLEAVDKAGGLIWKADYLRQNMTRARVREWIRKQSGR